MNPMIGRLVRRVRRAKVAADHRQAAEFFGVAPFDGEAARRLAAARAAAADAIHQDANDAERDRLAEQGYLRTCSDIDDFDGWLCTRAVRHLGDHEVRCGGKRVAVWPQVERDATPAHGIERPR